MKLNTLKLGIIGGGQLGMFLAKSAKNINIEVKNKRVNESNLTDKDVKLLAVSLKKRP